MVEGKVNVPERHVKRGFALLIRESIPAELVKIPWRDETISHLAKIKDEQRGDRFVGFILKTYQY